MMRKLLLLLLVVILFASCKQNKPVKIAFLGNSITIGSGLEFPETECYPSLIGQKLNEQFNGKYVIENYAVSGRTMLRMGDNPLWDEPQFSASLAFSPDIVYIMLGTNDSKPQNWDSFGTEFMADYQAMLDTFKTVNPNVKFILAYPPPAFEVQWGIRDSVIVNGVMPVVSALIEKNKT